MKGLTWAEQGGLQQSGGYGSGGGDMVGGAARSAVERQDGGGLAHVRGAPHHDELVGEVMEAQGWPGDGSPR